MSPHEKNEFDRQLRQKLEDFNPKVPVDLWDKIASQLEAQAGGEESAVVTIRKKRLSTWWMSVAAALLVVCGVTYWYSRPVEVTYLQGRTTAREEMPDNPTIDQEEAHTPAPEPLDVEGLKRVFSKKRRKAADAPAQQNTLAHNPSVTPARRPPVPTLAANDQRATGDVEKAETLAADSAVDPAMAPQEALASVPDVQPLVTLEEEEETLLASTEAKKQPFGVSNILNYVVGAVDPREEKLVTFTNDDEGSLKLDFNFSLAKNRKKKLK
ncbi:hypothetical protein [Parapedobacter sp. DT-150]|uniref:hypothetical protein n=1 Tax=Parapedobacter sp. DT-150 TaxID=3396162 RepID=UPI003F1A76CE